LQFFDPLLPSKPGVKSPRRDTFDQHASRTGSSASGTKKLALKCKNKQHNAQLVNTTPTPHRDKKAEQTSGIVSRIGSGLGSPFPSPSSSPSSSSSTSSYLKSELAMPPPQLPNLFKSPNVLTSLPQPSWSPAPIYSSPANRTGPRLMGPAVSNSFLRSLSSAPAIFDLMQDDTPEASEISDTDITLPSSPTTRSLTSSLSSQETVAKSATTVSPSPCTNAVAADSSHEDFNTTSAFLTHPSELAPQLFRKRGRPPRSKPTRAVLGSTMMSCTLSPVQAHTTKRRKKSQSASNSTACSRSSRNASTESSGGSTANPYEQETR
jgi:hypothetical protein